MGVLIDITGRLPPRTSPADNEGSTDDASGDAAPASRRRILGERPDGVVDLAAWRAKWRSIYTHEFTMDMPDGQVTSEGSLRFFHDGRSSSLEFLARGHDGVTVRHTLTPAESMRLLTALNSAYGFDPQGPQGVRMSEWNAGDDGPSVA